MTPPTWLDAQGRYPPPCFGSVPPRGVPRSAWTTAPPWPSGTRRR